MTRTRDKLEFTCLLAQEIKQSPFAIAELAEKLMRVGASMNRLAVALSNGDIDQDQYEIKKLALNRRLVRLLDPFDMPFRTGGDPRGFTLKLMLKGRGNTWGGPNDGYGVPGS